MRLTSFFLGFIWFLSPVSCSENKDQPLWLDSREKIQLKVECIGASASMIRELLAQIQSKSDDMQQVCDLACDAMKYVSSIERLVEH